MTLKETVRQHLEGPIKVVEEVPRKSDRTCALSGAAWIITYFAARLVLELPNLETWARIAISLTPLPIFAWFLWAVVRWSHRADELERRIQLEALAVAFSLTLLLLMTLGLLQIAIELSMDDWSYRHTWPIIYAFYFVGVMRARRRYE